MDMNSDDKKVTSKKPLATKDQSDVQTPPATLKKNNILPLISLLIALSAIVIALYTAYLNCQLQKKLTSNNELLATQINGLKQNQTQGKGLVDNQLAALQKDHDQLTDKMSSLSKQLNSATNQHLYQNQDWIYLKARHYLELAQINAQWTDSFDATIALLQDADGLLKPLTDSKVLAIRQTIATEITSLKSSPTVDMAGLLSQLDAAQASINHLTIDSALNEGKQNAKDNKDKTTNPSAWQSRFHDSVNLLEKLVVIRHNDEAIAPLLSPLLQSLLKENICLNLQEAQWAVLNHNPVVYQLALKQALSNLNRVSQGQKYQATELIKQLTALQQIKITTDKPTTGLAIPLMNQLIDGKELPATEAVQGGKSS